MHTETIRNDEKVRYLIKTLSRTKRKDYENYVVNAIWNRISKKIRPITQQYVSNPKDDRRHYFIDLYFPLINMGVECDELQHITNADADLARENTIKLTIQDELNKVSLNDSYDVCHIRIYNQEKQDNDGYYHLLSYEELEWEIDKAVDKINARISELSDAEIEHDWNILSPSEYFKDRISIKTNDSIIFKTQREINSVLFNSDYALQKGGYRLPTFTNNSVFDNHSVWYPQLVIEKPNGEKLARTDWYNQLLDGGTVIEEYHATRVDEHDPNEKKIVFAKDKDYLGNDGYKFVGIFDLDGNRNENEHVTWVYKKISDECPIIR